MRVLVTGHDGYIGSVLGPLLQAAGHKVVGVDSYLFWDCTLGVDAGPPVPGAGFDVRDLQVSDLHGFDAVVHLAAISNDPLGDLNPTCTYDINYRASARLARMAKAAGVTRFLFSSSCSLYGAHGDLPIDEQAAFHPVTCYGESKMLAERDIAALTDDGFSPTFLRNATAYGMSPRLRGDLVVNNLTGLAFTTGKVEMRSDGTPWRPLVHVKDIAWAFLAALEAPRERVHNEAFNVGATYENYRVREVAEIVESTVPSCKVAFAAGAGPDKRNYRVDCSKLAEVLPAARPRFTVAEGVAELYLAFRYYGLRHDDLVGSRLLRIQRVKELLGRDSIGADLRWRRPTSLEGAEVA